MTAITNVLIGGNDRITAEGRSVVIVDAHDNTWMLTCIDATTAHRLEACFRVVREELAITKAERIERLDAIERDAAGTDPAPAWVPSGGTAQADNGAAA